MALIPSWNIPRIDFGNRALPVGYTVGQLNEERVNELFSAAAPIAPVRPGYDCTNMRSIIAARGLIGVLDAGEFDAVFGSPESLSAGYVSDKPQVNRERLILGDWARFLNATGVLNAWQWEDVTVIGPDLYFGWPKGPKSYYDWLSELFSHIPDGTVYSDVQGYDKSTPYAAQELNFAKIAQKLFEHRRNL